GARREAVEGLSGGAPTVRRTEPLRHGARREAVEGLSGGAPTVRRTEPLRHGARRAAPPPQPLRGRGGERRTPAGNPRNYSPTTPRPPQSFQRLPLSESAISPPEEKPPA